MLSGIVERDGVKGLFRGLGPTLATVPTFWGFYFPAYEAAKPRVSSLLSHLDVDPSSPFHQPATHLIGAVTAGAFADTITNPMWVVRTRMQTETFHRMVAKDFSSPPLTMRETISDLYRRGGVMVFWRGLTASLLGLSHVAVQFPVYEYLKENTSRFREESTSGGLGKGGVKLGAQGNEIRESGPIDWMVASSVSKLVACILTYPHEVIRSRMMDARNIDMKGKNVFSTAIAIVKEEGWKSLYRGMHVSLLRVIPNCCLTFMSYEYFTRFARKVVIGGDEGGGGGG